MIENIQIINSYEGKTYWCKDDYAVFNLNTIIFDKYYPYKHLLMACVDSIKYRIPKINLANLASLCYRFNIEYGGRECINILNDVKQIIQERSSLQFVQYNILNYGEVDLQPIKSLLDVVNGTIYVNSILIDKLYFLGFTEGQLKDVLNQPKVLYKLFTEDLIRAMNLNINENKLKYEQIRKIFEC